MVNPTGVKAINRDIVQGSGISASLYLAMKSDLKSKSHINELFKLAEDTKILDPEFTDIDMKGEFDAFLAWATVNKVLLNITETKELIFIDMISSY